MAGFRDTTAATLAFPAPGQGLAREFAFSLADLRGVVRLARASVAVSEQVQSLIAFHRLNLMETSPLQGLVDAIFCRNVMINFDAPSKAKLVARFVRQIKPGGDFCIGHSESPVGSHPGPQGVGRTTYRSAA
jgi:chemotaxis protein methyltransferase CheR